MNIKENLNITVERTLGANKEDRATLGRATGFQATCHNVGVKDGKPTITATGKDKGEAQQKCRDAAHAFLSEGAKKKAGKPTDKPKPTDK